MFSNFSRRSNTGNQSIEKYNGTEEKSDKILFIVERDTLCDNLVTDNVFDFYEVNR